MRIVAFGPAIVAVAGIILILMVGGEFPLAQQVAPALLLALAAATTIVGALLPRATARVDSLHHEILVVSLAAMFTAGIAIALSAAVMMLEPSQNGLLLVVAFVGAGFGIIVEHALARELSADARRLRATAGRIGTGDLDARSAIERADEIGQAARAIDTMATRLASLESERTDARSARQAFLAAVGHDLRTPLSALRAALDALEDGLAPSPDRYFRAMSADIEAIRRLVDDLFLLARIEGGNLEIPRVPVDLSELADEAVEALTPVAVRKSVGIRVHADDGMIAPVGPNEISRVIRNLLDNAIRHTPHGSEVLVALSSHDDGILVRVLDEGDGFDADLRERLLKGLAGTARPDGGAGGAGLGFAIVRGLVESHGGRLWFEDGVGGRVAFWLPARI
ncbi:MAG: HAMP domain-containing histidine kinase [Chloroflexi bacterium]|nr:HAMP domain-containing histidine kinase [Chloroflexota bacterium]